MMYMPDLLRATVGIMEAPSARLTQRVYNLSAISFTPAELAESIRAEIPDFTMSFEPDFRQAIAATWPQIIDDSKAREDWGWSHDYDITKMTRHMIARLREQQATKL